MGRFTLRDEGKTICLGKILKYKPYTKGLVQASAAAQVGAVTKQLENTQMSTLAPTSEMLYDMETGEMKPKPKALDAIGEEAD
tara:strand:+ start:329 stop:577 length:249 start_codon:yes stop_codon:yes gene_type:complete